MTLVDSGSHVPILWVIVAVLLAVRVAVGVRRRNRRRQAPAPTPASARTSPDDIRPVAAPTTTDRTAVLEVRELTVAYGSEDRRRRDQLRGPPQ